MWKAIRGKIDRFRAVAAFKRRESEREQDRFPIVWKNNLQLVALDLAQVHESDPELLDLELVDDLVKARAEIISSTAKFSTAVTVLILFLLLTIFDIDMPVTFAGLQLSSSPGVAELAVLAVAILSAAVAGKAVAMMTLLVASKVLVRLLYPDELYYLRNIQFHPNEPPPFFISTRASLTWGWTKLAAGTVQIFLLLIMLLAIVIAIVAWRWVVYPELWQNPSADIFWCRLALIVALLIDLGWVAFVSFYLIPFPHRDHSRLYALTALKGLPGFERAAAFMEDEMYRESSKDRMEMKQKGFL